MKATLYEALGIPQAASDEEVRASLRRLIRKYYAKTRDGQGNVEEALRFINHASRILSDSDRRTRYDNELALSAGTTEQRIAHVVTNAVAESGEQTDVGTEAVDRAAAADVSRPALQLAIATPTDTIARTRATLATAMTRMVASDSMTTEMPDKARPTASASPGCRLSGARVTVTG